MSKHQTVAERVAEIKGRAAGRREAKGELKMWADQLDMREEALDAREIKLQGLSSYLNRRESVLDGWQQHIEDSHLDIEFRSGLLVGVAEALDSIEQDLNQRQADLEQKVADHANQVVETWAEIERQEQELQDAVQHIAVKRRELRHDIANNKQRSAALDWLEDNLNDRVQQIVDIEENLQEITNNSYNQGYQDALGEVMGLLGRRD